MIISIIGSGNTATVLGKLFKQNNHSIKEVIGRNTNAVQQLAETLQANACFEINKIDTTADIFIVAVKDDAVSTISNQLKLDDKIVVHTGGSVAINVLEKTSANYGVLYPLQSLRKELSYTPAIPFLVDGNNDFSRQQIFNLASSITNKVIHANDETRLKYHLSGIIASNFTNHLFALAKDYCNANNIDFDLLLPLIKETTSRLDLYEPAAMQTGPAIRGDEATIEKHLQLLNDFPQLKNIYKMMSESIIKSRQ